MHLIAANLISLERAEMFLAKGWPSGAQSSFADQARVLRKQIPPHHLARYEELKAQQTNVVVAVVDGVCEGCHSKLSPAALVALNHSPDIPCCEQCGRFVYLAEHYASSTRPTQPVMHQRTG